MVNQQLLTKIWKQRGLSDEQIQQKLKAKQQTPGNNRGSHNSTEHSQQKKGRPRLYNEPTICRGVRFAQSNYNYLKEFKSFNQKVNQIIKYFRSNQK